MTEKTEQGDYKTALLQKYLKFVFDTQEEAGIATNQQIFDFFYSEIEARENRLEEKSKLISGYNKQCYSLMREVADVQTHYQSLGMGIYPEKLYAKLSHLEELLKAADEIANLVANYQALPSLSFEARYNFNQDLKRLTEAYNKLKSTQKH